MRSVRFILAMMAAVCLSWRVAAQETTLTVYAASSLQDAFEQIGMAFEAGHPQVTVAFEFGGSSSLATRIRSGAPADVFASASETQMQNVVDEQLIAADTVTIFARNTLTLIVPADNRAGIASVQDLQQPGVGLITAAAGVPIRTYTDEMLLALNDLYGAGYSAAVAANILSEEENVRLVVTKIALGEGDAGIVYRTDVTPDVGGDVLEIPLPAGVSPVALYPMAVISDSDHAAISQQFVDFVLSKAGQTILQTWQFCAAPPADDQTAEMTPEAASPQSEVTPEMTPMVTTGMGC